MRSAKTTGRIIGALLLVQLAGLIVPFVLLHPVTTGAAGYLADASAASLQIKVAVFYLFANSALTIGIAIAALPVFRQYGYAIALWLLSFSIIWFTLQAVDNAHVLSMLSLSQEYAKAGASPPDLFLTLASMLGATRKWVHFSELLVIDCWIFLLYISLYRSALVPRAFIGFGLLTVMLHFIAIPFRGFLGYSLVTTLGVPMGFSHIALALWLMVKGFKERDYSRRIEAHEVA